MTPERWSDYLQLFSAFVLKVYSSRLGGYAGETFKVTGTRPAGKQDILVRTEIIRPSGPPLDCEWRVRVIDGRQRIIDVMVAGISMAITQCSEFTSVISQKRIRGPASRVAGSHNEDAGNGECRDRRITPRKGGEVMENRRFAGAHRRRRSWRIGVPFSTALCLAFVLVWWGAPPRTGRFRGGMGRLPARRFCDRARGMAATGRRRHGGGPVQPRHHVRRGQGRGARYRNGDGVVEQGR